MNAEKLIGETIESIIHQSYNNFEIIIIDGLSTDGTLEVIKKYERSIEFWISESDSGIYDAWNKGILKSTGDWICFVGAGDSLEINALEWYVNEIENYPDFIEYVSSSVEIIDCNKKTVYLIGSKWEWEKMRKFMNIAHVGSFHSRKMFEKYGLFDSNYKISGDYELFLRIGKKLKASFFPKVTARMLEGGVSTNERVFSEVLRAKIAHSTFSNLFEIYFLHYFILIKFKIKRIIESVFKIKFILNR